MVFCVFETYENTPSSIVVKSLNYKEKTFFDKEKICNIHSPVSVSIDGNILNTNK